MNKKLLATIGPSSLNKEVIQLMELNGVNLLRINLSHTKINDLKNIIESIKLWSSVPICLDSEGAQIRNQDMINESVVFTKGDHVNIHKSNTIGDSENISFTPSNVYQQLDVGDLIYVDFNSVELRVIRKENNCLVAEVVSGGTVGSNKAVNVNKEVDLDPVTEKDIQAFNIGKKMGILNYSLSFTNSADDVKLVRKIIGKEANLISKIESIKGVLNLDQILPLVDQILIDRGDLSREVVIEKIPFIQRRIISNARSKHVPVFVATNLLESMINVDPPTRAEVNDVVSTLLMGADGLVLAAETAIGKYPIEAVKMIQSLIKQLDRWTPESSSKDIIFG